MGIGRKIEKGFGRVDKFVSGVGRKAEGAVGSINKLADKAERGVEKTINKADEVLGKGVDTANKAIQQAGKVGDKAIGVGYNIAKKVDRGLDAAARSGAGDITGVGDLLTGARALSESAKRGLGAANEYNEKLKRMKVKKGDLRDAAVRMSGGNQTVSELAPSKSIKKLEKMSARKQAIQDATTGVITPFV